MQRLSFDKKIEELDEVLNTMEASGFQVSIKKSKCAAQQAKYLGQITSVNGHSADPKKMRILVSMKETKTERKARRFLGGINFYRKMWRNRLQILEPWTELTGNVPFSWKHKHQKAFDEIKAITLKETMLCCPNFELPLLMFLDASDMQLGFHVSHVQDKNVDFTNVHEALKQEHCPALMHSRKLKNCQTNHTVTGKELLSVVDALIEHRPMLHRATIYVCSDRKNLTHLNTTHDSARV